MSERGYAKWNPKPEALYWVRAARDVLEQYRDYWPLSVRQIFYRLVADFDYEKSEAGYNRLTGYLSRARRAGLLPWEAIRDGGLGRTVAPSFFGGEQDFLDAVRRTARNMKLDRQSGQEKVIELWCEAGGMVPILQGIAAPYSARVNTGGGYDSVTAKHKLAVRVAERAATGLKTVILHVGDFDPSGEDMCDVLRDDTRYMVVSQIASQVRRSDDGWEAAELPEFIERWRDGAEEDGLTGRVANWALDFFDVERVALTAEQVVERGVETAPPKRTDSRMAAFVARNRWVAEELGTPQITAQLEALTPPELEELLRGAIEAHMDMDAYERTLAEERDVRMGVLERLGGS